MSLEEAIFTMKRSWSLKWLLAVLVLTTVPALAHAQEVAGLVGTITDPSGGAVAQATVKLTNTKTGSSSETQSNDTGYYRFVRLAPGPGYELTVTKDAFKSVTVSNLYLPVATMSTQDIALEIGSVTQRVEVKSEGSVSLDTTDTTIGNNFDIRMIESLPNEFRDNPANLLRLEPGVVSAINDDASGSRDGAVAGGRADQNNITVDGIDTADFAIGQAFTLTSNLPVDAIQEFRTEVGNPLAVNGRGSGAQTMITTKGGTNDWHGNLREYHRNTITEANTFFNNKAGVPRTNLIRNQFGGDVGGPVKKDKLFFFFDYDARRDASQSSQTQIVPLDHFKNGGIAYINNNAGCGPTSRLQSNPNCITILTPAQVMALDPCNNPGTAGGPCTQDGTPTGTPVTPGFNPAMQQLLKSRYPEPNDLSQGDGINTGGFRFNAPAPLTENTYTVRVDFNITSKQKLFVRGNWNNIDQVFQPSIQFPGDPITQPVLSRNRFWALGHTWTFGSNKVNQFVYGEARNNLSFPIPFNPAGTVYPLNWFPQTPLSNPYIRQSVQSRIIPVPTFRDDFSYIRGRHSFQIGGVWKPIRTRQKLVNDFDFINIGIGGAVSSLTSDLRPSNILQDPNGVAVSNWDGYFVGALGAINLDQSVFNYSKAGTAFPHGAGERRDYRYYNYEAYIQDSWKVRPNLTFTYGVRYQYDSVPYESNGYEATAVNATTNSILLARAANGLAGVSGPTSAPLLTYTLAGKANHGAPSLYAGDKLNFSPRLGLAWNPNFREGLLASVFGDHKTVVRAGFGMIYDQTAISAVNFLQDQGSYLFGNVGFNFPSGATPGASIASDPRFVAINALPFTVPPPPFQNPLTPNCSGGSCGGGGPLRVTGSQAQSFNYAIDPKFKTPYSLTYSFGVQRELPGDFQLEVDYYGRFGRRLFTLADAGQIINFVDPASKTDLVGSISSLEVQARQGTNPGNIAPLPFFQNQSGCDSLAQANGLNNCTQLIYASNQNALNQGNLFGVVQSLTTQGLLPPGVGLSPQFSFNVYVGNKAWSSYNAMFLVLRKRLSHNLQMDFNYTLSHSIDNSSIIANNNGNGVGGASVVLCDATNLSVCRGNSEFDVTHQITANAIYDLPFGHGQMIGRDSARWLNEIIGGWELAGLVTWRTGLAFPVQSGVSTTSGAADALAIFTGNPNALRTSIHTDVNNNNTIQFFADPTAARGAFSPVTGLQVGNRDTLRGPGFSNWDLALIKKFPLFNERYNLTFRADAYNAFNHPNFALPHSNINGSLFGQITALAGQEPARVLQFALRFDF
jgi:hypothetical protein